MAMRGKKRDTTRYCRWLKQCALSDQFIDRVITWKKGVTRDPLHPESNTREKARCFRKCRKKEKTEKRKVQ